MTSKVMNFNESIDDDPRLAHGARWR